jgi:hypothetical protein
LGLNNIAKNKDGEKLLVEIYSTMQTRRRHHYVGNAEIREAFDKAHKL